MAGIVLFWARAWFNDNSMLPQIACAEYGNVIGFARPSLSCFLNCLVLCA